jgi:hypothetical protein
LPVVEVHLEVHPTTVAVVAGVLVVIESFKVKLLLGHLFL